MEVCEQDHEPVAFVKPSFRTECPLCEMRDELNSQIETLQSDLKSAQEQE